MKYIAVIPVCGRIPLLKHTITRLLKKNGCYAVICAGSNMEERIACTEAGAHFIYHENYPLGKKWNALFLVAREMGADACLFVGSSDWVSDKWIKVCEPYLEEYGMVGKAGCYMVDISSAFGYRLVYWPGYAIGGADTKDKTERINEPIGIGRLLSKKSLDKMDWKPFNDHAHSSLDWTMYNKVLENEDKVKLLSDNTIHSMSISTDIWSNKHAFDSHWNNELSSEKIIDADGFCSKWFPEYNCIFQ